MATQLSSFNRGNLVPTDLVLQSLLEANKSQKEQQKQRTNQTIEALSSMIQLSLAQKMVLQQQPSKISEITKKDVTPNKKRPRSDTDFLSETSSTGDCNEKNASLSKLDKRRAQIALASRRSRAKRKAELGQLREEHTKVVAQNNDLLARNTVLEAEVARLKKRLFNEDNASNFSVETERNVSSDSEVICKDTRRDKTRNSISIHNDTDLLPLVEKLEEKVNWLVSGFKEDVIALIGKDLPDAKKRRFNELKVVFK